MDLSPPVPSDPESARSTCAARCPMCGSPAPAVHVHGHMQCAACGVNIDPCCGGAPLDDAGEQAA